MTTRQEAIHNARQAHRLLGTHAIQNNRLKIANTGQFYWYDANGYIVVLNEWGTVNAKETKRQNEI